MANYTAVTATGIYEYINGANGVTRATVGDTVTIASGIYGMNKGELNPSSGVTIIGLPGSVIVSSGSQVPIYIKGGGSQLYYTYPVTISGVTLDCSQGSDSTNNLGGIIASGCTVNLYKCIITGRTNPANNGFTAIDNGSSRVYANLYQCQIYNISSDCLSIRGQGAWTAGAQNSYVKAHNCLIHSPGQKNVVYLPGSGSTQGAADQCITAHDGIPIFAYGCTINNGQHFGGPGPGYIYFSDIDSLKSYPNNSGINSGASPVGHHVVYGNNARSVWQFSFTTRGTGVGLSNSVWRTPQVQLRQYGLLKNNKITWNYMTGSSLIDIPSNGNLLIDSNIITSTGTATNKTLYRIFQQQEDPSSTGVSIIFKNNYFNLSNDTDIIRCTQSVPVGTGLNLEFINNTFNQGRALISGGTGSDWLVSTGSTTVVTKIVNNYFRSSTTVPMRGNTAASDVWGIIWMSGNILNTATPTSFPGSKHINAGNTYSATVSVDGSGHLYTPVANSVIDYGYGVPYSTSPTQDSMGPTEGTQWIGSRARDRYDQTEFPTSVTMY